MFKLLKLEEAKNRISKKDILIENINLFEIQMKMNVHETTTKQQYLDYLKECVCEWDEEEIKKLKNVEIKIVELFEKLSINKFDIEVVKTNGLDEYNSAYTRETTIYLPPKKLKYEEDKLVRLMLHEIFHVMTRTNKTFKKEAYKSIGYDLIEKIDIADNIKRKTLTNPDAPICDSVIELFVDGSKRLLTPLIYLNAELEKVDSSKDIFNSIEVVFVEVIKDKNKIFTGDKTYRIEEVSGYEEKVGDEKLNQPEEILAELFVDMVLRFDDEKSKQLREAIKVLN